MTKSFIKISQGFLTNWDIEKINSCISNDIRTPINHRGPYYDPSGIAHWQFFPTHNISFARNFYQTFTSECLEVANKLIEIQESVIDDNELSHSFINHKILPQNVNIIKTFGGKNVGIHCDSTRNICVNIGLKNSNTFRTRISNTTDVYNFYNTETYTMEDGDVYLISIRNAHCVDALTNNSDPRYIITYTLF